MKVKQNPYLVDSGLGRGMVGDWGLDAVQGSDVGMGSVPQECPSGLVELDRPRWSNYSGRSDYS